MFCGKCGQKIEGNDLFCSGCGARVREGAIPPPASAVLKKPGRIGKIIKIAAVCLAVVLVFSLVLSLIPASSPDYIPVKNDLWCYYDSVEGQSRIMSGTTQVGDSLEGEAYDFASSLDGSVRIFGTSEGGLFAATPTDLSLITDDVLDAALSADGSAVAYVTQEGILSLYEIGSQAKTQLAEGVLINSYAYANSLCISPDGKSVLYLAQVETDEETEEVLFLYTEGEVSKIGKALIPVGLSNGGGQIYYYDAAKSGLYATNTKGDTKKISAKVSISEPIFFNTDMAQIMFLSDAKWYVSIEGGEKIRLGTEYYDMNPVFSPYADASTNAGSALSNGQSIQTLRFQNLYNQYYTHDETLYYLQKNWTLSKFGTKITNGVQLTEERDMLYYATNNSLYSRGSSTKSERSRITADLADKEAWAITPDGRGCYYVDESDALWYQSSKDKKVRVADDVYDVYVTHDGSALFLADYGSGVGTLYGCTNGKNKKLLFEDCSRIDLYTNGTVLYVKNDGDEYSIYAAEKGLDFENIADITK